MARRIRGRFSKGVGGFVSRVARVRADVAHVDAVVPTRTA